jgi:hypothetical protein
VLFPGGSALEKLVRHSTVTPTPVEAIRPDVPPGVAAVVRKLLAKNPAERYQTPAELAAALVPFASESASWPNLDTDALAGGYGKGGALPDSGVNLSSQPAAFDEIAALVNTLGPDQSPTSQSWSRTALFGRDPGRGRVPLALALAVTIVLGMLAAVGLLSMLLSGK